VLRTVLWWYGALGALGDDGLDIPLTHKLTHGMMELRQSLRSIPKTYEATVQSKTLVLVVNRVISESNEEENNSEDVLMELVEKIVSVSPVELRTSYLSVDWVGEPGEGPGPIREFFGSYLPKTIFTKSKSTPPNAHLDSTFDKTDRSPLFAPIGNKEFFWPTPSILGEGDRWCTSHDNVNVNKYLKKIKGMKSITGPYSKMEKYFDNINRSSLWCYDNGGKDGHGPKSATILGHGAQRNMWYECCGRLMGLSILSRSTLGLRLPILFFYIIQKLMQYKMEHQHVSKKGNDHQRHLLPKDLAVEIEQLQEIDPVFYSSLKQIVEHNFKKDGSLDMCFTYTDVSYLNKDHVLVAEPTNSKNQVGEQKSSKEDTEEKDISSFRLKTYTLERPLVENGNNIEVTDENKVIYAQQFATSHIMNRRFDAFRWLVEGMLCVFPPTFYTKFTPKELQSIICSQDKVNVQEWREACQYEMSNEQNAIVATSQTVQWFWQWVEEGDAERHANLLEFWSGSRYPPVFGFKKLDGEEDPLSGFKIHRARERKKDSLPTAATCDRLLELPSYKSYQKLANAMEMATTWCNNGFSNA
jgi:hypothetical protein